jgi:hypothetical protein
MRIATEDLAPRIDPRSDGLITHHRRGPNSGEFGYWKQTGKFGYVHTFAPAMPCTRAREIACVRKAPVSGVPSLVEFAAQHLLQPPNPIHRFCGRDDFSHLVAAEDDANHVEPVLYLAIGQERVALNRRGAWGNQKCRFAVLIAKQRRNWKRAPNSTMR